MPVPAKLLEPISTLEQAKAWIELLVKSNLHFHLEDDATDIGNTVNGKWVNTFSKKEGKLINLRRHECYTLDWGVYECPLGYMGCQDGTFKLVNGELESTND